MIFSTTLDPNVACRLYGKQPCNWRRRHSNPNWWA